MKFAKGQSGNPGGRPKKMLPDGRSLTELARLHTDVAIEALSDIVRSEETPAAARVSAAVALLDRGWGKPTQALEVAPGEGTEGGDFSVTVTWATPKAD